MSVFKPPCSFWFLLLFGVGGLVLFIHLQDLSDMVLQQAPAGVKFRSTTQSRQEQCGQFSEIVRLHQRSEESDVDPISPMQLPDSQWKRQAPTPGSREHDPGSQQVTKRPQLWHDHMPKIYIFFVFMNIHFYIPFEKFRIALNFELPSPK